MEGEGSFLVGKFLLVRCKGISILECFDEILDDGLSKVCRT